jgi:hypothetical protein
LGGRDGSGHQGDESDERVTDGTEGKEKQQGG